MRQGDLADNPLWCTTDADCCGGSYIYGGNWYYPNGDQVKNGGKTNQDDFYRARRSGRIELHWKKMRSNTVGIFRCRMRDGTEGNPQRNIYIGIYHSRNNGSLGKVLYGMTLFT